LHIDREICVRREREQKTTTKTTTEIINERHETLALPTAASSLSCFNSVRSDAISVSFAATAAVAAAAAVAACLTLRVCFSDSANNAAAAVAAAVAAASWSLRLASSTSARVCL
jgi:hypothetical protein